MEERDEFKIGYSGRLTNLWKTLMLSIISAVLNMLSTSTLTDTTQSSTVFCFFLSILIVMYAVYSLGIWGVIVALLSSTFFCLSIEASVILTCFNVLANGVQAVLLWIILRKTTVVEKAIVQKNTVTDYNIILIVVGVLYAILSFCISHIALYITSFVLIVVITVVSAIVEKNINKIYLLLGAFFAPSLIGGLLNSVGGLIVTKSIEQFGNSIMVWSLSNSVLFATFGYILLTLLTKHKEKNKNIVIEENKIKEIDLSTLMFYVAALIWNIWFYFMYFAGWLDYNTITYLFPWIIGNVFFLINAYYSNRSAQSRGEGSNSFEQAEKRAVVAEENTQKLIAVIAFMIPLCASWLGSITTEIAICFIINITVSVVSIGLIWIPKNDIKSMKFIQTLKTIFHLYTLSFLLLVVIMLINGGIKSL